eukprot:6052490-Prorocentrum_lima.AAC.1
MTSSLVGSEMCIRDRLSAGGISSVYQTYTLSPTNAKTGSGTDRWGGKWLRCCVLHQLACQRPLAVVPSIVGSSQLTPQLCFEVHDVAVEDPPDA